VRAHRALWHTLTPPLHASRVVHFETRTHASFCVHDHRFSYVLNLCTSVLAGDYTSLLIPAEELTVGRYLARRTISSVDCLESYRVEQQQLYTSIGTRSVCLGTVVLQLRIDSTSGKSSSVRFFLSLCYPLSSHPSTSYSRGAPLITPAAWRKDLPQILSIVIAIVVALLVAFSTRYVYVACRENWRRADANVLTEVSPLAFTNVGTRGSAPLSTSTT
jgi:hypothetical protein